MHSPIDTRANGVEFRMERLMKRKSFSIFILAAVLGLMAGACATTMSQTGEIGHKHSLDVSLHPEDHPFSNVRIDHKNGSGVLTGSIKHNHRYQETDAHVDVAVLDSTGKVLFNGSVAVSASRVRGRYRIAGFEVPFPDTPAENTVVHVAYHSTKIKHEREHDCTDNQAVEMGVK